MATVLSYPSFVEFAVHLSGFLFDFVGAMENWGLVTYREPCLLVDPENTSAIRKQYIALVVGHELAHQWFGNLVTMASISSICWRPFSMSFGQSVSFPLVCTEEFCCLYKKGKAVPVNRLSGCEMSRLTHFLDSQLREGGEVSCTGLLATIYPPGKFLVLISVRG
jgi:hypothetical protein